MRTRTKIVIPSLTILAVVFALASSGVVAAQSTQPVRSESHQTGHCANAQITDMWADVLLSDPRHGTEALVIIEWSYVIDPWPDDSIDIAFSVHRRPADSSEWTLLFDDIHEPLFEAVTDSGTWVYWIGIASITIGDVTELCSTDTGSATDALHIPTEEERAQETLALMCPGAEVIDLRAIIPDTGGPDSTLMLKWRDGTEYMEEYDWPFLPDVVHYQVERVSAANVENDNAWQTLGTTTEQIWTSPADFGDWIYRVATIRLEGGGATTDCEVWWAEVEVQILTEEEKTRQEGRLSALKSEMIRCGTAKLTEDIQGEARQVVADYVSERVAEIIADQEDYRDPDKGFQSLVAMTVLLCTDEEQPSPYGGSFGSTWAILMMLEEGELWLW